MQPAPARAAPQPAADAFTQPACAMPACDNLELTLHTWADPAPFYNRWTADPWLGPPPSEFQAVPVALRTAGLIAAFARGPESGAP